MADYVRVFETSNAEEANEYINKGWDLIDAPTVTNFDGDSRYSSHTRYTLGLSAKEYANRLLAIVKEYEKHGFKDAMFEEAARELNDNVEWYEAKDKDKSAHLELYGPGPSKSPVAKFMADYEDIVNEKKVSYFRNETIEIDDDNNPFD